MALVLALYLLLCVRVTADVCAGRQKGRFFCRRGRADVPRPVTEYSRAKVRRFPLPVRKSQQKIRDGRRAPC
ncbi:MAG: hypothetical protein ACLUI3_04465 [Christensenellales bacterium]